MRDLRTATSFLTRIPMGIGEVSQVRLARSVPWFGVVGALVGLVVAGVHAALLTVAPPLLAAAVAVVAGVVVTGAFHEDGLADVADSLGGRDVEHARQILKDPTHGTYGVLALVGSVVVRVAAVAALDAGTALATIPAAHALARTAAVGVMASAATSAPGLGAAYIASLGRARAAVGIVLGVVLASFAVGMWVLAGIVAVALVAFVLARPAARRFGGVNGDVLGAVEQVAEVVLLVLAAVAATAGWVVWWLSPR